MKPIAITEINRIRLLVFSFDFVLVSASMLQFAPAHEKWLQRMMIRIDNKSPTQVRVS